MSLSPEELADLKQAVHDFGTCPVLPQAWALGFARGEAVDCLDTLFPVVNLNENLICAEILGKCVGYKGGSMTCTLEQQDVVKALTFFQQHLDDFEHMSPERHANLFVLHQCYKALKEDRKDGRIPVLVMIEDLQSPVDISKSAVPEIYLRLSLLSHCKTPPNSINLDGIFGGLPNVCWTDFGPMTEDEVMERRLAGDTVKVHSRDKIPHILDYVIPKGVRIADGARVRLGAHLAPGTTVMQEGFVNFNAGTLGASMVEGRISAGVVIGDGSDLGGGCSTMGTLSGGNDVRIRVGERSLIGANAGIGIPLGDDCIVEAGLYLTGSTKVEVCDGLDGKFVDDEGDPVPVGRTIKAYLMSNVSGLLFRRHSIYGKVQALPNKKAVALNEDLHSND